MDWKTRLQQLISQIFPQQEGLTGAYEKPTPTPTLAGPSLEEIIRAIQTGTEGAPVATMAGQMANTGQNMPIFQKYPFLQAAISQLESGGFKAFATNPLVTKPKQGFGWAVNVPSYNPSIEQVLQDMMSGIGTSRQGESQARQQTASYYEPFRQTGDINQFANVYAGPRTEEQPYAGNVYADNLKYVMNLYAQILDEIMQERGTSYPTRY